jgi:hypothetical protein
MNAPPVVVIDVMADKSTYLRDAKLTPPTKFWPRAVADALASLRVPRDTAITFRRQGVAIRHVALSHLLRGDS